ncbi:MAG: hypothetical protein KGO05_05960 [Chloroflexota bacterium]|nr:hypothetical protein [Chloroflexota bacterium]
MTTAKTFYWLLVGALFGFGFIAILSIGIIFIVAGLALLIFGAIRLGGKGLWAGVVGFGLAPAAVLIWDVTSKPWACIPASGTITSPVIPPGAPATYTSPTYYTCVNTFAGPLTTYHVLAAIFLAITLVGLLIGLGVWLRSRRNPGGHTPQLAA